MAHIIDFEVPEDPAYSIRGRIIVGWVDGTYRDTNLLAVVDSVSVPKNLSPQAAEHALSEVMAPHALNDRWVLGSYDGFRAATVLANAGAEGPYNMMGVYIPEAEGRLEISDQHAPSSGEKLSITVWMYGYREGFTIPAFGQEWTHKGLALGVSQPDLQYDHLNDEYGEIHRWTSGDRERWLEWVGLVPAHPTPKEATR
ncbi:hypothetical protein LG293_17920 (plasmid) [Citricoccus nitrophenolicus]